MSLARIPLPCTSFLALVLGACTAIGPFEPEQGSGVPPGSVSVIPSNPTLFALGARQRLALDLGDGVELGDGEVVQWSSSAPRVVSVTPDGTVTALADGTATISARWNGFEIQTVVAVSANFVNSARVTSSDQFDPAGSNNVASVSVTVRATP